MVTGNQCCLCKNNWGTTAVMYNDGYALITVYVCEECRKGKTDYEIFKQYILTRYKDET